MTAKSEREATRAPKVAKVKRAGRKYANSFDGWLRRKHEHSRK